MQSILGIKWKDYGNCASSVPETFILGSFLQALNDPVHHKEFGMTLQVFVYSSSRSILLKEGSQLFVNCSTMYVYL